MILAYYKGYIGIMENKMETTTMGSIGLKVEGLWGLVFRVQG